MSKVVHILQHHVHAFTFSPLDPLLQPFERVKCHVLVDPCVEDPLLELLGLCLRMTFPIFAVGSASAVVLLLPVFLFSHAKYPSAALHSPPPVGVFVPSPGLFGGTLTLVTLLPNVRER